MTGTLRVASFLWCFCPWLLGGEQPGSLALSMAGFGTRVSWKNILGPKEKELARLEQWRALFSSFSILSSSPADVSSPSLDRYGH